MDYRLLVVLHVLAAVTWAGGVVFMGFVAVPAARRLPPEQRRVVTNEVGRRARTVGWVALGVLVATGLAMAWVWGARWSTVLDGSFFAAPRNRLLGYKVLLVAVMLVVTGFHDWVLGPRHAQTPLDSPDNERLRRQAAWLGRLTGLLVLAIVVIAVFLARGWVG